MLRGTIRDTTIEGQKKQSSNPWARLHERGFQECGYNTVEDV